MKNILLLPGDGIGPEIMAEAEKILHLLQEQAGLAVALDYADLGGCAVDATGEPYPEATRTKARAADAVLLGYNLDYPNTERFLRAAGETEVPVIHASTSRLAIDNVADNPGLLGNIFHICAGDELYGPGILSFLDHVEAARGVSLRGRRLVLVEPPPGMDVLGPRTADHLCDRGVGLLTVGRAQSLCDAAERAHIVAELAQLDPDIVVCASFLDERLLVDVLTSFTGEVRRSLVFSLFTPSLAGFIEDNAALVEGLVWSTQTGTYHDALGQRFRREDISLTRTAFRSQKKCRQSQV